MQALFTVMAGGALGAGSRHVLSQWMLARLGAGFPWSTLTANIVGGLLMGLLVGGLARGAGGDSTRLFLGVGVLGGFTTFSSFSIEFWQLLDRSQPVQAAAYVAASLVGALAACGIGLMLMRQAAA